MAARSNKRRRLDLDLLARAEANWIPLGRVAVEETARTSGVLPLFDFVYRFGQSLPLRPPAYKAEFERLSKSLVFPSKTLPTPVSISSECGESLSNVVDDVICSLLQRQARVKKERTRINHRDDVEDRNVLCHGYVLSSELLQDATSVRPCPNMQQGVLCTQVNCNVSFCKSSSLCQTLHRLVGDEMLRILLLHTTILLPIADNVTSTGNYLLLCGSLPVQLTGNSAIRSTEAGVAIGSEGHKKLFPPTLKRPPRSRKRKRTLRDGSAGCFGSGAPKEPNASIPRHAMFYSDTFTPKVGLPATHVLNQNINCETLLKSMFSLSVGGKVKRKLWTRLRTAGLPMCGSIIERQRKCDYARFLQRFCAVPTFCSKAETKAKKRKETGVQAQKEANQLKQSPSMQQVASSHTRTESILSFLMAVLRTVFPQTFFGSEHNFHRVRHIVKTFIEFPRNEKFPFKILIDGIRVKDVKWLCCSEDHRRTFGGKGVKKKRLSRTNHGALARLVSQMMQWTICHFLVPLVRSTFYVTDGEFSGNHVLYYRKPVWSIFRSMSMNSLLNNQYIEISTQEASSQLKKQKMGCSRLRLKPKKTGVRPLATLSKREVVPCEDEEGANKDVCHRTKKRGKLFSTNAILTKSFEVFRYERSRNPGATGAGVFGLDELYPLLKGFLKSLRERNPPETPRLYFTTVDIHRCFDNINQDRLLEVSKSLLSEVDYVVQKRAVVQPSNGKRKARQYVEKRVGPPELLQDSHLITGIKSREYSNCIFGSDVTCSVMKKETILDLLREHLFRNTVVARGRFGNRYLVQRIGIPQGSILSSLLCNIYYGYVENALLSGVVPSSAYGVGDLAHPDGEPPDPHAHMLVRIVDDFLLVTTDQATSLRFLERMSNGSSQLGVHINGNKTRTNYAVPMHISTRGPIEPTTDRSCGSKNVFFPWCGMLFDTSTGEVRVDYSRLESRHSGEAITIDKDGKIDRKLQQRMRSFVRPRIQPIFFDSAINSTEVIAINFYQTMLLCALKATSYLKKGGVAKNVNFVLACIGDVIRYAHNLIKARCQGFTARICQADTLWLGRDAFTVVFEHQKQEYDIIANQLRPGLNRQLSLNRKWGSTRRNALNQFGGQLSFSCVNKLRGRI